MSLLFKMLSRLVITFLSRSKHLLISWLQSLSAVILEPRKIKSATVSPSICREVMGPDAMILVFWMLFIGRTDAEAETPILWPSDVKNWLIWKNPDAGKDWRQEEKGTTEDEMVGWHQRLNGHGFGWTPVVGVGQGGLACCDSWGHKELDTTEWLI